MKIIGYITTTIFAIVLSTIVSAYVFTTLWSWFIVTTFGAKALSIPAAIGIILLLSFTKNSKSEEIGDGEYLKTLFKAVYHTLFLGGIWLLIGYIVKFFI